MPPALLPRDRINTTAWDACVAASAQSVVYGYSWYLDAILPQPDWKWMGLVLPDDAGGYRSVMPVPLRRKFGIWRVHQPLFCQVLGVFGCDPAPDPAPFYRAVCERFRYGSVLCSQYDPSAAAPFNLVRQHSTQVLDLSAGYDAIYQNYTPDRRRNLRRALTAGWTLIDSSDLEPLLTLFRDYHAGSIGGGVGLWAYEVLRNLHRALQGRGLATLRYAVRDEKVEAGALFVREGSRIIYLFNAASEAGGRGNARTLLIDEVIQQNARCHRAGRPLWFDFESPEKPFIRTFYASFGPQTQPFWSVQWNRLTGPERAVWRLLTRL